MKLIHDNCEPIPPWYPLPLLPQYEISTNLQVRLIAGSLVKITYSSGTPRVLLRDAQSGSRRFYGLDWLWRMSQATDKAELLEMELTVRRDIVLTRVMSRILSMYESADCLAAARASERIAVLKILSGLLYNKNKPTVASEPKVMSIDTMRKYAQDLRGEPEDADCESEHAG